MSVKQWIGLLNFIKQGKHDFARGGWHIKYIDHTIDMRTCKIFSVTFRMMGDNRKFFRVDDEEGLQKVYDWLEEGKEHERKTKEGISNVISTLADSEG